MPISEFVRTPTRLSQQLLLLAGVSLALVSCDSDLQTSSTPTTGTPVVVPSTGAGGGTSNSSLSLQVGDGQITLTEGEDAISVPVSVTRSAASTGVVELSVTGASASDENQMTATFSQAQLAADESSTSLSLQLAIDALPIQAQTRSLTVTASIDGSPVLSTDVDIAVTPTNRPDVYLLVGQSNMVGFSEDASKLASTGGLDAPNARIKQLNVTGNDGENFATAADFTTAASVFNEGMPVSPAVDPLHDGYDTNIEGKSGQRIGPALSFAKRALLDTTAEIVLVPAAWSDTGFCKRDTNRLPGVGWNATAKNNAALAGTLLYERAVLRANVALAETDGVLRAILWHQGEADSDDAGCAETYADNLMELVTALRTNIDQDARGAVARGPNAELPFIVGTMSMGSDAFSDQTPFSDLKQLVDDTHRNIANLIPLSDVVNNDDLIPDAYPCGEGSCIHFGAAAYREMGNRYYQQLFELMQ
ncbi:sialate O-acetylesterase [Granulosicoccus antarcticus]|uniref:Sialate O-acetylesterase domain-containing protein n=1 Tax=Granulosicoccus antarcticus IMCC3135 TaxID=1192854 RepID=A0A2Z2NNX1_9GAMM|nr:sialate O-acetylesterase [Granulosicoccus antarcticus]ASJ72933.1 hypothetical protein IMCC3135_14240 [Granulosicoccus antarcticus IMCC3135]